jgi:hypothetical protein
MRLHSTAAKGTADFATSIFALFMLAAGLFAEAAEAPGSGGRNAAERADSPYLVLISIDGFSPDYLSIYPTPALDRIAASGVRAEGSIRQSTASSATAFRTRRAAAGTSCRTAPASRTGAGTGASRSGWLQKGTVS